MYSVSKENKPRNNEMRVSGDAPKPWLNLRSLKSRYRHWKRSRHHSEFQVPTANYSSEPFELLQTLSYFFNTKNVICRETQREQSQKRCPIHCNGSWFVNPLAIPFCFASLTSMLTCRCFWNWSYNFCQYPL